MKLVFVYCNLIVFFVLHFTGIQAMEKKLELQAAQKETKLRIGDAFKTLAFSLPTKEECRTNSVMGFIDYLLIDEKCKQYGYEATLDDLASNDYTINPFIITYECHAKNITTCVLTKIVFEIISRYDQSHSTFASVNYKNRKHMPALDECTTWNKIDDQTFLCIGFFYNQKTVFDTVLALFNEHALRASINLKS